MHPHPRIHFGGESDPALKRVADLAQVWYGFSIDPDQTAERFKYLGGFLATIKLGAIPGSRRNAFCGRMMTES